MVSLKQIKYALAVAEHLHFKKAADACAISQSALSSAIHDMEQQLGCSLFERDNKKVLVTEVGAHILQKARQVHVLMSELDGYAAALQQPLSGPLSIGLIPTIAPYLLPLLLPEIVQQYPNLQLQLQEDQSQSLIRLVMDGHLDSAILALPYDCRGLLTLPFWQEDFLAVVPSGSPLGKVTSVSVDQLMENNLMLLSEGHCLRDHALQLCQLQQPSQHSMSGTSLHTLVQLVAGNMGTTLVPRMALSQLVDDNPMLHSIPLTEPGPHRQLAFVVRPNFPGFSNIERLKHYLHQQLSARRPLG